MTDKDINDISTTLDDGKVVGVKEAGTLVTYETKEWSRNRLRGIKNITSTAYDLIATDEGQMLIHSNASASVINIPADATLTTWPIRGSVKLMRDGAGQITVTALSGVTLKAAGRPKFRVTQSVATLTKIAANTWVLEGDTLA